jgi:tetratricopeptide (TPR) repeat protein
MALMTEGAEAGFAQLDRVAADFKNTPAAGYAMLLKGNILYSQENFAQAANVYKELLNSSNKMLKTEASLSYAAALQGAQDYPASIEVMKDFIATNSKSFALPQAYLTLALSQELAGQKDEAINNYKHLLENYTKTYFGTFAKDKLTQLQK